MKTLGTISLAVFLLVMTGAVAAYSQDRDDSRQGQAQEEKNKPNIAKDKDKDKDNKREVNAGPQEEKRDKDQPGMKDKDKDQPNMKQQERHEHPMGQKEQRPDQMDREHHQHQAGAKQGKKIPDDKFRANFGREHRFKVQRTQVINVSQPVVVYGGYNFQLVDAWPADWGFEDDCYIDYIDGEYFLFNVMHPGVRIAVFVVG